MLHTVIQQGGRTAARRNKDRCSHHNRAVETLAAGRSSLTTGASSRTTRVRIVALSAPPAPTRELSLRSSSTTRKPGGLESSRYSMLSGRICAIVLGVVYTGTPPATSVLHSWWMWPQKMPVDSNGHILWGTENGRNRTGASQGKTVRMKDRHHYFLTGDLRLVPCEHCVQLGSVLLDEQPLTIDSVQIRRDCCVNDATTNSV
jgi:hypothetical protein